MCGPAGSKTGHYEDLNPAKIHNRISSILFKDFYQDSKKHKRKQGLKFRPKDYKGI